MGTLRRRAALAVFALMTISAPLAFGAADHAVRTALVALLAVGMWCVPPGVHETGRWMKRLLAAAVALLVLKEFAPAAWFGETAWRAALTGSYGVDLPWSHHPEPGRAVDGLLTLVIAALWFLWVRRLASESKDRVALAWILFGSAICLAGVCLFTMGDKTGLIYGFRPVAGWAGFGPFPNRNHTACFLAMGVLMGCGCAVRAARRGRIAVSFVAVAGIGIVFLALMQSRSRGGLIACVAGLALYAGLALAQSNSRKNVSLVIAAAMVAAALFFAFGGKVLGRFHAPNEGNIPTNVRWGIWSDTAEMWRDAPLLGHGIGTFAPVFPIYQTIPLNNQIVLHPESSWMKWLAEFGAVLLAVAVIAGGAFYLGNLRRAFLGAHGFMVRASGFAAFAVLMIHSVWDVPASVWATAGFGLAALAFACPLNPSRGALRPLPRVWLLVPLGIAIIWALPLFLPVPAWSAERLARLLKRNQATPERVRFDDLHRLARWFPLSPELHQALGMRLVAMRPSEAWQHFRLVDRLRPGVWTLAAKQAAVSRDVSPGMCLHFWTVAIERAAHRRAEVFGMAHRFTLTLPTAPSFWARYATTNPSLLLVYAAAQPEPESRLYFQQWWELRALGGGLEPHEVDLFYRFLPRQGAKAQLDAWMRRYPEREARDFKTWAAILHAWNEDAAAWPILARNFSDPPFPPQRLSTSPDLLEATWLKSPDNAVNAQALAAAWHQKGDTARSKNVILKTAAQANPPSWFMRKAAHLHAGDGAFREAVEMALKEK